MSSSLVRLASSLPKGSKTRMDLLRLAKVFPTKESLADYLKEHPKADKSKHSVGEAGDEKGGKKKEKPSKGVVEKGGHSLISAGGHSVLMSSWAKGHITGGHNAPGKGSVFSPKMNMEKLQGEISKIPADFLEKGGGVFKVKVPNAGYDLVHKASDILKKNPNAKKVTVEKEERGKIVEVTGYIIDDDISDYATDEVSVVVRPTKDKQYLPPDLKEDADVGKAVDDGKAMSVLSSWPGKETPPASQWGDDYAVIIPNGGKGANWKSTPKKEGSMKLSSQDVTRLFKLASGLPKGDPTRRAILASLKSSGILSDLWKKYKGEHPNSKEPPESLKEKAKEIEKEQKEEKEGDKKEEPKEKKEEKDPDEEEFSKKKEKSKKDLDDHSKGLEKAEKKLEEIEKDPSKAKGSYVRGDGWGGDEHYDVDHKAEAEEAVKHHTKGKETAEKDVKEHEEGGLEGHKKKKKEEGEKARKEEKGKEEKRRESLSPEDRKKEDKEKDDAFSAQMYSGQHRASVRGPLIRLAYQNPGLRKTLLPLISKKPF